jgi:uroporphyrinogen-III decarboxylase
MASLNRMEVPMESRMAIALHDRPGSHEALARALHALIYAKGLNEKGASARIIFDGAGTEWPPHFRKAQTAEVKGLAALFDQVKGQGLVYEIRDFCSGAFGVREELKAQGAPLVAQYGDHPSIASLVAEGYQIWIL